MKIAISSENPTKVAAVKAAAQEVLGEEHEFSSFKTPSGVPDQPIGLDETYLGAETRARNVLEIDASADIGVGLEGGMVMIGEKHINFGIVYVLGRNGLSGIGLSQGHAVPQNLVDTMEQTGQELSEAVADHYGTDTVTDRDCSGVITGGALTSEKSYREPTILALLDYLGEPSR